MDDIGIAQQQLREKIRASASPKCQLYISLNPSLSVHELYGLKGGIRELERVSWTRLRLSAHSLAIEEGRWNRRGRGRLPVEERLCSCGEIQTEKHVLEQCRISNHIRRHYDITTMENLMERTDYSEVCAAAVHSVLMLYT